MFQDPASLPSAETERELYDMHENSVEDPAYRRFLQPVVDALLQFQLPPARGLDFGCGHGPALAAMLVEKGYDVSLYDHFYFPDTTVLDKQYDFVTCTETAEHFHSPAREFERLFACLEKGGHLILMTRLLMPEVDFPGWWYHRDPTHVVFYSSASLRWLAESHAATLNVISDQLAVFRRT